MRSREEVLREFGLDLCVKGDTCPHYDCTGERRMADAILTRDDRLAAQQPTPQLTAAQHVAALVGMGAEKLTGNQIVIRNTTFLKQPYGDAVCLILPPEVTP